MTDQPTQEANDMKAVADWYRNATNGEIDAALQSQFIGGYKVGASVLPLSRTIDIVLQAVEGTPDYTFVEIESPPGKSIHLGQWVKRDDGFTAIRFNALVLGGGPENRGCNCGQCGRHHASGCAVHSKPPYQRGKCDCVTDVRVNNETS